MRRFRDGNLGGVALPLAVVAVACLVATAGVAPWLTDWVSSDTQRQGAETTASPLLPVAGASQDGPPDASASPSGPGTPLDALASPGTVPPSETTPVPTPTALPGEGAPSAGSPSAPTAVQPPPPVPAVQSAAPSVVVPTPPPPPPPPPPPLPALSVRTTATWTNGWKAEIVVTNTGNALLANWALSWTLGAGDTYANSMSWPPGASTNGTAATWNGPPLTAGSATQITLTISGPIRPLTNCAWNSQACAFA